MNAEQAMSRAFIAAVIGLAIFVAGGIGWVWNIVKLVGMVVADTSVTPMFVGRAIGLVVPIIGAVLGYL